ncbi:MAG: protein translocase subunit SecD [Alphaproteobacteria bacterium]
MVRVTRWQVVLVVAICVLGLAFAAPNFLSRRGAESLPGWLPNEQLSLGLDLQGGSHLLLQVDLESIVEEELDSVLESARSALREARIGYSGLGIEGRAVVVKLRERDDAARAAEALQKSAMGVAIETNEDGTLRLALPQTVVDERQKSAVAQSVEIVRRRIDEVGLREPVVQRQGVDRVLVQLPGVEDPERIKRLLGKTAKLTFHLLDPTTPRGQPGMAVPPGAVLLPSDEKGADGKPTYYVVRKRVEVSGDRLTDAAATFQNNEPVVSFRFDTLGGKKFGDTTQKHVSEHLGIVLDGRVISAPVIREPILGGSGVISGRFTVQEVQDLALLLRAGALPAPLLVIEERTVGPTLGADSIAAGSLACTVGIALVVVFMALAYGLFGLFADIALVLNVILILGVLSLLQATLTLPGIAGIVLTVGMAVDANVLINERIREEVRAGRTPISAVDAGYRRAFNTILDSNLTTLFAGLLLFGLGSGPIKGFAVTLSIGIVTSMFSAIMVTRMQVVLWLRRWRPQAIPI